MVLLMKKMLTNSVQKDENKKYEYFFCRYFIFHIIYSYNIINLCWFLWMFFFLLPIAQIKIGKYIVITVIFGIMLLKVKIRRLLFIHLPFPKANCLLVLFHFFLHEFCSNCYFSLKMFIKIYFNCINSQINWQISTKNIKIQLEQRTYCINKKRNSILTNWSGVRFKLQSI